MAWVFRDHCDSWLRSVAFADGMPPPEKYAQDAAKPISHPLPQQFRRRKQYRARSNSKINASAIRDTEHSNRQRLVFVSFVVATYPPPPPCDFPRDSASFRGKKRITAKSCVQLQIASRGVLTESGPAGLSSFGRAQLLLSRTDFQAAESRGSAGASPSQGEPPSTRSVIACGITPVGFRQRLAFGGLCNRSLSW